jgi:hypothetical protein
MLEHRDGFRAVRCAGLRYFHRVRLMPLRALGRGEPEASLCVLDGIWPRLEEHHLLQTPIVRGPALAVRISVLPEVLARHEGEQPSCIAPGSSHSATACLRQHIAPRGAQRQVVRMVARVQAQLQHCPTELALLDHVLAAEGVPDAQAFAAFVTPGFAHWLSY